MLKLRKLYKNVKGGLRRHSDRLDKLRVLMDIYEVETDNNKFTEIIQREIICELVRLKK